MRDRMKAKAPAGIKGRIKVHGKTSVVVDHRAAFYVEHGMAPLGDQPVSPLGLAPWVSAIGKDPRSAFAIAWAIGRKGIKARPFMAPAIKAALKVARQHFGQAWSKYYTKGGI
jgi:hypothetical protein